MNCAECLKIFALVLCITWPFVVYCEAKPLSYVDLLNASVEEIEKIDIAEMNLACALGLPGSEKLDITSCIRMLDHWAAFARAKTEKQMPMFIKDPGDYNDSMAYFKVLVMVTALELDIGVNYNYKLVNSGAMDDVNSGRFYRNSEDVFLHGILSFRRLGTCASMPVLMVAIGRRLGYPLKLVSTKAHLYARWEDDKETFNIETSSGKGLSCPPDSYYREWPFPITEKEIKAEGYLKSMSPMQELACFLGLRGLCLAEHRRYFDVLLAYEKAYSINPNSEQLLSDVNKLRRVVSEALSIETQSKKEDQ